MNIQLHLKDFKFEAPYDTVKEYLELKLQKVRNHLGTLATDEVVEVKVDLYREDTKSKEDHYYLKVVFNLPNHRTLVAEARGVTPQVCIDDVEAGLMTQVEKLRDKANH